MIDIQAGDAVEYIGFRGNERRTDAHPRDPISCLGQVFRAEAILPPDDDGDPGILLVGVRSPDGERGAYKLEAFRKIDKATDEFTTQIKAIRPIREDA